MRICIDEKATCSSCVFFDPTPNETEPKNGTCTTILDDGLPPFETLDGIAPDRPACRCYVFDPRKEGPDENR